MGLYNIISCSGFGEGTGMGAVGIAPSACMGARISIVGLFFLIAFIRKWGAEEWDIEFSFMWSLIMGLGLYFILITLFGSLKIAFLGGTVAALAGGYGIGQIAGDGDGDY